MATREDLLVTTSNQQASKTMYHPVAIGKYNARVETKTN